MKLVEPENNNYAATVVEIKSINELEGCDNVVGTPIFGFQAIVSKDTQVGDVGIVFPAETQLSEEYARENNLHRHGNLNADPEKAGYLEDNRRVKSLKFRGQRSDCLFMPLESLSYIKGLDIDDFEVGDTFDRIGDHKICRKYVIKRKKKGQRVDKNKKEKFVRVEKKFLPEHFKTDNFFRNEDVIPGEQMVYVTQKLHGTSIRIANTIVARPLRLADKIAKRLGVPVKDTEFDYVYGSRRVIKDANNPNHEHFYDSDIWTQEGKKLEGAIPQNFILYGELIGWTPEGAPLQKNYTYQVPREARDLYVYRVAFINGQGVLTDLSWDQVIEFCQDRDISHVPELWRGKYKDFDVEEYMDKRFHDEKYPGVVPLDEESPVDEGVCIRVDRQVPYILKAKSPVFYEHETKMLDEEAEDIEEEN